MSETRSKKEKERIIKIENIVDKGHHHRGAKKKA
jgi:hypothetical protein